LFRKSRTGAGAGSRWTVPGAIDTFVGFGSFAECEFKGQAATVAEATDQLTRFITASSRSPIDPRS
jgi:hypothetical protein